MLLPYLCYLKDNKLLFDIDEIEFWRFGPVIKIVYDSLKYFKNKVIDALLRTRGSQRREFELYPHGRRRRRRWKSSK